MKSKCKEVEGVLLLLLNVSHFSSCVLEFLNLVNIASMKHILSFSHNLLCMIKVE